MQYGCCFTKVWRPLLKAAVTTLDDFFQLCMLPDPCSPLSTVAVTAAPAIKDQYLALLPKVCRIRSASSAAAPLSIVRICHAPRINTWPSRRSGRSARALDRSTIGWKQPIASSTCRTTRHVEAHATAGQQPRLRRHHSPHTRAGGELGRDVPELVQPDDACTAHTSQRRHDGDRQPDDEDWYAMRTPKFPNSRVAHGLIVEGAHGHMGCVLWYYCRSGND